MFSAADAVDLVLGHRDRQQRLPSTGQAGRLADLSKQTLLTISVTEDEIDGIGGETSRRLCLHEVLPVARQRQ